MKAMLYSTLLAVALSGGLIAFAGDGHDHKHDDKEHKHDDHKDHQHGDDKKGDDKKAPATKPANKTCPIMTDNAADDRVTIQHEGKTIGFCCEDCIPEFKKNPEKYTKNMK